MEWEENLGSLVHTYWYLQEVGKINNTHKKVAPTAMAALGKWWANPGITDWKQARTNPRLVPREKKAVKTHNILAIHMASTVNVKRVTPNTFDLQHYNSPSFTYVLSDAKLTGANFIT